MSRRRTCNATQVAMQGQRIEMQNRRTQNTKNTKHEETSQNYILRKKPHSHVEAFPVLLMEFQAANTECSELGSLPPFSHAQLAHRDLILDQDSTPHLTSEKGYPQVYPLLPAIPHASLTIHSEHPLSSDRGPGRNRADSCCARSTGGWSDWRSADWRLAAAAVGQSRVCRRFRGVC